MQDPKDTFWAHTIHVSDNRSATAAAAACRLVTDAASRRGSHVVLRRFREFDELRRVLIQVTCNAFDAARTPRRLACDVWFQVHGKCADHPETARLFSKVARLW